MENIMNYMYYETMNLIFTEYVYNSWILKGEEYLKQGMHTKTLIDISKKNESYAKKLRPKNYVNLICKINDNIDTFFESNPSKIEIDSFNEVLSIYSTIIKTKNDSLFEQIKPTNEKIINLIKPVFQEIINKSNINYKNYLKNDSKNSKKPIIKVFFNNWV